MEEIIHKVMSKHLQVRLNSRFYKIRKFVPAEILQMAEFKKRDFLDRHKFDNFMSKQESIFRLVQLKIIDLNFNERIKTLEKQANLLKIDLYKNRFDDKQTKQIRGALNAINSQQTQIFLYSRSFDHLTLEGMAEEHAREFIVQNCVEGKISYQTLMRLIPIYDMEIPNSYQIREMCKSNRWRSIWLTKKTDLFDREVDEIQTYVISLSRIYDSVYEAHDRPEDFVIQDNDMLDGWMLHRQQEQDKESARKEIDQKVPAGASEVFIPAKTASDANRINSINTEKSHAIKKYREEMLKSKKFIQESKLKK